MKALFRVCWWSSLVFCLLLSHSPYSFAQAGCTDPQAINYDANALNNDGSCRYADTEYSLSLIANLPAEVDENSGLAFTMDRLWTQNDGGNAPQLFELDTLNGSILQSLSLGNAMNRDWEELAEDNTYLYIGDFGNNSGDRMDLRIYRFLKSELSDPMAMPELIEFSYSDQNDFTPSQNNHNFDCEAFFAHGDSLHLFSKNWVDGQTRHYTLPNSPGEHIAQVRDSMVAEGLITAADIDEEGHVLLLGYVGLSNFMWLLFDYPDTRFFQGNRRKIELGSTLSNGQTEGLTFSRKGEGFISSEGVSLINLSPRLYSFSILQWIDPIVSIQAELSTEKKNCSPMGLG